MARDRGSLGVYGNLPPLHHRHSARPNFMKPPPVMSSPDISLPTVLFCMYVEEIGLREFPVKRQHEFVHPNHPYFPVRPSFSSALAATDGCDVLPPRTPSPNLSIYVRVTPGAEVDNAKAKP